MLKVRQLRCRSRSGAPTALAVCARMATSGCFEVDERGFERVAFADGPRNVEFFLGRRRRRLQLSVRPRLDAQRAVDFVLCGIELVLNGGLLAAIRASRSSLCKMRSMLLIVTFVDIALSVVTIVSVPVSQQASERLSGDAPACSLRSQASVELSFFRTQNCCTSTTRCSPAFC